MSTPNKVVALALLIDWKVRYEQMEKLLAGLLPVFGCHPESQLHETLWFLFDGHTTTLARLLGDEGGWLEWFCHENDMGAKGHEAGYDGDMRPIKTLEDLYMLITDKGPAP